MCTEAKARAFRPSDEELGDDTNESNKFLGVNRIYEGTFPNGQKFDSSYDRNEPAVFGVNQVIAGWTEALQLMSEGSAWELYIPYNLAYGEAGAPGAIPPYSALVFKV